jgi:hypothetical protein
MSPVEVSPSPPLANVTDVMDQRMSHLYDMIWVQQNDPITSDAYHVPPDEEPLTEDPTVVGDNAVFDTEPNFDDDAMAIDMADNQRGVEFQSVDLSQYDSSALLPNRRFKILVRPAYLEVYDKIGTQRKSYVFLGQPGIGKCLT